MARPRRCFQSLRMPIRILRFTPTRVASSYASRNRLSAAVTLPRRHHAADAPRGQDAARGAVVSSPAVFDGFRGLSLAGAGREVARGVAATGLRAEGNSRVAFVSSAVAAGAEAAGAGAEGGAAGTGTGGERGCGTVRLTGTTAFCAGRASRQGSVTRISAAASSRVMIANAIAHGPTRAFGRVASDAGPDGDAGAGRSTRGSGAKIASRSRATGPRGLARRAFSCSCASALTLAAIVDSRDTLTQPALIAAVPASLRDSAKSFRR